MRIGINGFGRIGRNFTKALLERYPEVEIAAVNDLTSAAECAHLFKWDSNYGAFPGEVSAAGNALAHALATMNDPPLLFRLRKRHGHRFVSRFIDQRPNQRAMLKRISNRQLAEQLA